MTLRHSLILLAPLFAGCATQMPVAVEKPQPSTPPAPAVAAMSPTKIVETRYEVRGYREATNPDVRHEAHAVHRRTVVPATASDEFVTVPRESFPPASYAPLPDSDELAAELATQRAITAEIREMQASMAETERQMQEHYALLLRQSADVLKAREQLEAERRQGVAMPAEATAPAAPGAKDEPGEVKW